MGRVIGETTVFLVLAREKVAMAKLFHVNRALVWVERFSFKFFLPSLIAAEFYDSF